MVLLSIWIVILAVMYSQLDLSISILSPFIFSSIYYTPFYRASIIIRDRNPRMFLLIQGHLLGRIFSTMTEWWRCWESNPGLEYVPVEVTLMTCFIPAVFRYACELIVGPVYICSVLPTPCCYRLLVCLWSLGCYCYWSICKAHIDDTCTFFLTSNT